MYYLLINKRVNLEAPNPSSVMRFRRLDDTAIAPNRAAEGAMLTYIVIPYCRVLPGEPKNVRNGVRFHPPCGSEEPQKRWSQVFSLCAVVCSDGRGFKLARSAAVFTTAISRNAFR
jgi:hypothetical protein